MPLCCVLELGEKLPEYLVGRSQIESRTVKCSANPFGYFLMAGSIDAARIFCANFRREKFSKT